MGDPAPSSPGGLSPVAVVWCRQVDNEAESPGYTTIPEEFPGRRETLEAIRVIGNLTINVADTHDYWDPDPAQPLSYYPNLFLYPAASGRYTCVGRMFLSTEDRPRLGMKTLVFSTAELVASGEFGPAVLRAHATMGGPSVPARVSVEPDVAVYQTVGEGFLFHRGTTEPVVVVAADQWEAAAQVVLDLVRLLPTSLVALGAFLVFPSFLPEAKVNLHEFTEQVPLALAVMRVSKGEAQGERHSKRIQSWESGPVALRDLTKITGSKARENLPLVLQYARDHLEHKVVEVARRVDLVEGNRTRSELADAERQAGRDRRKEMWRIGTAMETAALLLTRPKGRSVPMSGEAAKRAHEYLQAQPSIPVSRVPEVTPEPLPAVSATSSEGSATQHPPWLQRPTEIHLPPSGPVAVPVSVSDDPSVRAASAPASASVPAPASASVSTPAPMPEAPPSTPAAALTPLPAYEELEARLKRMVDQRIEESVRARPSAIDPAQLEARLMTALEARTQDSSAQSARALLSLQSDVGSRIAVVESRPVVDPGEISAEVLRRVREQVDPLILDLNERLRQGIRVTSEQAARALLSLQSDVSSRIAVVESRPVVDPGETSAEAVRQVRAQVDPLLADLTEKLKQGLQESSEQAAHALSSLQSDLIARIAVLEAVPVVDPGEVSTEVERRVRSGVDSKLTDLTEKLKQAVLATGEAWAGRLRDELRQSADEIKAHSAHAEEDLAAALAAQIDLELRETREQGTALREELEGRVREVLKEHASELDSRRAKEVRDLEQRLGILLDGRTKDLERRLLAAVADQKEKLTGILDERIGSSERRLGVEREARVSEVSESQTQALAGLQVRLQAYFEQKLRESQEREREKYLELLARLKGEVDQSLAKSTDSTKFDTAVRERVAQFLEATRSEQGKVMTAAVADAEIRLRSEQDENVLRLERVETKLQQRETELLRVERGIRSDVDELDRRMQVMSDRMLPLVRRTWLKVGELEKGVQASDETEGRIKDLRREVLRELRRLEGEFLEQTGDLRDRLEGTIAHQGRIWLNLLKQLSAESAQMSSELGTGPRSAPRPARAPDEDSNDDFLANDLSSPVAYAPFSEDPPNPLNPTTAEPATEDRESRRRRRP
jgi:hypothetical protein